MYRYFYLLFFILIPVSMIACSDSDTVAENPPETETKLSNKDHIWKTQTDALKQTQQLREQLEQQARQKQKQLQDLQK